MAGVPAGYTYKDGGFFYLDGSGPYAIDGSGTPTIWGGGSGGGGAVTIADGAAVTLGAKADVKSTATDGTAITMMQVFKQISASVQAPPSQAVTNAGTFAVQPAALVAGAAIIGQVGIDQTTPGTTNLVALARGATGVTKNEDDAAASGDTGLFVLHVRRDAVATQSGTNGDYTEQAATRFGSSFTKNEAAHARTFSAAFQLTPAATATDIVTLTGAVAGPINLTKVRITGVATAAGMVDISLVKRSAADTGGTSTAPTVVAHDATDGGTAGGVVSAYTANPAGLGSLTGALRREYMPVTTAATAGADGLLWDFYTNGKAIYLPSAASTVAINLNGVTATGLVLNIYLEWVELP